MIQSNKIVNTYYHRIFSFWEDAKIPKGEQMSKFLQILKPVISHAMLGHKYTIIGNMLDAAYNIEKAKKDISNNFFCNKPPLSKSWNWNNLSLGASSSIKAGMGGNTIAIPSTNLVRTRNKPSGQDTSPNAKLIPTSVKPIGWSGTWFKPEKYLKKLKNQDHIMLICKGQCWACHRLRHHRNNKCCPLFTKQLNVDKVAEQNDSGSEKN